jgi:DNA polymerase I
VVLGALYGLGARGLVSRLKTDAGIDITEAQARSYLDAFFASFPSLDRWRRSFPRDTPIDTRTLSGRRRLAVGDYTQKINSPIQGAAADIFKVAMGLLFETRAEVPSARLVLSVHDELVLEVVEAEADAARVWLARCMREAGERYLKRVPVVTEVGVGPSWAETKKSAAPLEEDSEWAA